MFLIGVASAVTVTNLVNTQPARCQAFARMSEDEFVRFFTGMLRKDAQRMLRGCREFDGAFN